MPAGTMSRGLTGKPTVERKGVGDGACCRHRPDQGAPLPVGGGRVKLTPDHKNPHSLNSNADPVDPQQWQALCGRHQVTKKNYWDSTSGKMNTYAIVQFATRPEKEVVFKFLLEYFGYVMDDKGEIKHK